MTETTKAEKLPVAAPCVASVLWLLSLLFMGWTAPVFLEMFRDFGVDPLPYPLRLISHLHWHWTLPLGGLIAAGLLWSSRHWSRRTTLAVDAVAMALAVVALIAFFCTVFRPIFRVNGAGDCAGDPARHDARCLALFPNIVQVVCLAPTVPEPLTGGHRCNDSDGV